MRKLPPAPVLIPRRLIDSTAALATVKAHLPVGKYLELLHIAALEGSLPVLDPWTFQPVVGLDGRAKREAVSVEDRIKILGQLVNKVVPDAKPVAAEDAPQDPELILKQDFKRLSRDQLLQIVSSAASSIEVVGAEE